MEQFAQREQGRGAERRYADLLIDEADPLTIEAALYRQRETTGSWWTVGERLFQCATDIYHRRASGAITTVQSQSAFERLQRALSHFYDRIPHTPHGPALLLAAVPGDRLLLRLTLIALGAVESGCTPRWAGHATAEEILQDLRRAPAAGVIVSASFNVDPKVVARSLEAYETMAQTTRSQVALVGAWPDPSRGAVRLDGHSKTRQWVEQLRQIPSEPH